MKRTVFTAEQDHFREACRAFVQRHMTPHLDRWDEAGIVDRELFLRAGELGVLGLGIPEQYGGGGTADYRFNAVFMEEACAASAMTAALGIATHADVVVPYFVTYGTDRQHQRWLPGLASGDLVGAIAMTEPGTGSDLAAISTRATRHGDQYMLTGSKTFISNAFNADVVIVVCRTGADASPQRSLSLLVVDTDTPGFQRGRNLDKIGQHAADTGELFFDEVEVPAANLLGSEGRGFYHLMAMLPQERLSIAVAALAHAERAFTDTLQYCKDRHAFGQPIGSFQHSRFVLATMRTELDVAQAFVDRCFTAHGDGELTGEEAAEAKWVTADLNNRVLDRCLQLHGGFGYMDESLIGRAWRDGRAMSIYGGTNEIMKDLIGRRMLGV